MIKGFLMSKFTINLALFADIVILSLGNAHTKTSTLKSVNQIVIEMNIVCQLCYVVFNV